jgi:HD superfamily phosphodiesterase
LEPPNSGDPELNSIEPDLLYNHWLRVSSFGAFQGERRGLSYDPELLYIGARFHDIGLVEGIAAHTTASRSTAPTLRASS